MTESIGYHKETLVITTSTVSIAIGRMNAAGGGTGGMEMWRCFVCFPLVRRGLLDFQGRCRNSSSFFFTSSPHNNKGQVTVGTPGPQHQAPDHRALPDLNRDPKKQRQERSGHARTSTASARSQRMGNSPNSKRPHNT